MGAPLRGLSKKKASQRAKPFTNDVPAPKSWRTASDAVGLNDTSFIIAVQCIHKLKCLVSVYT